MNNKLEWTRLCVCVCVRRTRDSAGAVVPRDGPCGRTAGGRGHVAFVDGVGLRRRRVLAGPLQGANEELFMGQAKQSCLMTESGSAALVSF